MNVPEMMRMKIESSLEKRIIDLIARDYAMVAGEKVRDMFAKDLVKLVNETLRSPQFQAGAIFHKIGMFASDMKKTRKCLMNVHCNSQSVSDIDPRVRGKVMVRIYLPGARPEAYSRIQQKAIDNLLENHQSGSEAYLEFSGKFGKTIFRDIYRPVKGVHWEARVKNEK